MMNWKMKNKKVLQRAILLSGVVVMGLTACNTADEGFEENIIRVNVLKAGTISIASELFDEVMEISDETLDIYEMFLFNRDGFDGHDEDDNDRGGGMGHGMGGMGIGESFRMDDFGHMAENMEFGDHYFRLSECTEISQEQTENGNVTTVDFGESNCMSIDGKQRRGKIIISLVGDYWTGEAEVIFTFDNYFVDDNQVLGTKTVSAFINEDGNRENEIIDEGSIILSNQGGTIEWNSQKTRVVISGSETYFKMDDVIELTGISTGVLANGISFESKTETPLLRNHDMHCSGEYVSGINTIILGDGTEISIDYGDGSCDNIAEVMTNGVVELVELDNFEFEHGDGHCDGDYDGDEDGHRGGHGGGHHGGRW